MVNSHALRLVPGLKRWMLLMRASVLPVPDRPRARRHGRASGQRYEAEAPEPPCRRSPFAALLRPRKGAAMRVFRSSCGQVTCCRAPPKSAGGAEGRGGASRARVGRFLLDWRKVACGAFRGQPTGRFLVSRPRERPGAAYWLAFGLRPEGSGARPCGSRRRAAASSGGIWSPCGARPSRRGRREAPSAARRTAGCAGPRRR